MDIALWIVAGILALVFLMAGMMKIRTPYETLIADEKMGWTNDYDARTIRLIGVLEVLAAIGLIVPALTGIIPMLVPLAAIGLVLMMVGAMATHLRRENETQMVMGNAVFLLMALFVAWGRFGDYAF